MTNAELFSGLAKVLKAGGQELEFSAKQMAIYPTTRPLGLAVSALGNALGAMSAAALNHAKEG